MTIYKESKIYIDDNSVKVFSYSSKKICTSFKGILKSKNKKNTVENNSSNPSSKSRKVKGLLLNTRLNHSRKNGIYIKFPEVRGVLINDDRKVPVLVSSNFILYPKELLQNKYKVLATSQKDNKDSFTGKI